MNPISNSLVGNSYAEIGNSAVGNPVVGSLTQFADVEAKLQELKAAAETKAETAEKVGKEFESVFVSLLLKEMRNTLDSGEGGMFGSEQSDTFGGMFDQFMGQHLADASPLGIADSIKSYLKNSLL